MSLLDDILRAKLREVTEGPQVPIPPVPGLSTETYRALEEERRREQERASFYQSVYPRDPTGRTPLKPDYLNYNPHGALGIRHPADRRSQNRDAYIRDNRYSHPNQGMSLTDPRYHTPLKSSGTSGPRPGLQVRIDDRMDPENFDRYLTATATLTLSGLEYYKNAHPEILIEELARSLAKVLLETRAPGMPDKPYTKHSVLTEQFTKEPL